MFSSEILFHKTNKILSTLSNNYLLFCCALFLFLVKRRAAPSPGVKHDLRSDTDNTLELPERGLELQK